MNARSLMVWITIMTVTQFAPAYADDWKTHYERTEYMETSRYDETVAYCERLAAASDRVRFLSFGTSPQGRDLPLLIMDKRGNFTPRSVRATDNAVLFVLAGIHSGEICGKDAGLTLIRDMAIDGKYKNLLDNVTLLFVPIFNVDGHERFGPYNRPNQNGPKEMGWRTTAQNLNLNRDFVKADAPEMRAWLRLYNEWLPEFFIDCHSTDGADYQYAITYALEIFGNMDPGLTAWQKEKYLAPLKKKMAKSNWPTYRYNSYKTRHEPRSGILGWVATPRFSEGYTAIQNRPGLLIETHMLKPYQARVESTYEMIRHTIAILNEEHSDLRELIAAADANTASPAFRKNSFGLDYTVTSDSIMMDFDGYEYEVVKSDLTGGDWHQFSDKKTTFPIPYFNELTPTASAMLPEAYLIPAQYIEILDLLRLHGVSMTYLGEDTSFDVEIYRLSDPSFSQFPFEGRHRVSATIDVTRDTRRFSAGSVIIDMNQRAARVVAHTLEPNGPDSFFSWGFLSGIVERKEYIESYVIEELAREMLANNPALKTEFETKMAEDAEFAENTGAIRDWFYRRSRYWDSSIGVYPIVRIMDRRELDNLAVR